MFCDEEHMAELGGAHPVEKVHLSLSVYTLEYIITNCSSSFQVPSILEKQLSFVNSGKGWTFKVVPEQEDLPVDGSLSLEDVSKGVGTVCIWEGSVDDAPATEMGWGIATPFQRCRFATKAITLLLEMAVESGRWGTVHVFTSTTNVPSNALCKSCGFVYQGEEKIDYDGRDLFTTHYTYETQR